MGWEMLTKHDTEGKSWRLTNYGAGEKGDAKALLIGRIPYENIEEVNWEGDEYYGFPHIYCLFSHKGEPYEYIAYCTQGTNPGALPFYTEIARYKRVRRLSKKLGLQ
jgi:hypothetical protein